MDGRAGHRNDGRVWSTDVGDGWMYGWMRLILTQQLCNGPCNLHTGRDFQGTDSQAGVGRDSADPLLVPHANEPQGVERRHQ